MNLKSTPNNLAKLEKIFEEAKYILRYEKGTFNSGYCILEHKKVVVVNRFLNMEGKINTLMDILPSITLEEGFLTPESQKLYRQIKDNRDAEDAAENAAEEKRAEAEDAAAAEKSDAEAAVVKEAGDTTAAEESEEATDAESGDADAGAAKNGDAASTTSTEENPTKTTE